MTRSGTIGQVFDLAVIRHDQPDHAPLLTKAADAQAHAKRRRKHEGQHLKRGSPSAATGARALGGRGMWRAQGWSAAEALRTQPQQHGCAAAVLPYLLLRTHEKPLILAVDRKTRMVFTAPAWPAPHQASGFGRGGRWRGPCPRRRRERGARQAWPLPTGGRSVAGRGPHETAGRR